MTEILNQYPADKCQTREGGRPDVTCSPSLPLVTGAITIDPNDPEVLWILSKMCFTCGPIAHIFQRAGYPIPTHAEEEHGHVILWMLGLYRDYGDDWRTKGDEQLLAMKKANAGHSHAPQTSDNTNQSSRVG